MRVITKSEAAVAHVMPGGVATVSVRGVVEAVINPDCPTEALLAIVADRLKDRDENVAEFFAAGHVDEAIRELKGYSTRLRQRSQKQGRG